MTSAECQPLGAEGTVVSKTGTDLLSWSRHSWGGSRTGSNGRAEEDWGSEGTDSEWGWFGVRCSRKLLEEGILIRDWVR